MTTGRGRTERSAPTYPPPVRYPVWMYRLCTAHSGASVHVHTLQHHRRIVAAELSPSSELSPRACELVFGTFGTASSTAGAHTSSGRDPSRSPLPRRRRAMRSLARSKPAPTGSRGLESTAAGDMTCGANDGGTRSLLRSSTHEYPRGLQMTILEFSTGNAHLVTSVNTNESIGDTCCRWGEATFLFESYLYQCHPES